jgi:hypothetical protein
LSFVFSYIDVEGGVENVINQNFTNSNEIYPILELIRREMQRAGMYSGGDDISIIRSKSAPDVISVETLREMASNPALVTTVVYTYDNGTIERMTLFRDEKLIVSGFLIEIETSKIINEQLEEEYDVGNFKSIRGTIIRENGLFKRLNLEYVKAV